MPESAAARRLWRLILLVAIGLVVADFVRHPFVGGSTGGAAERTAQLTLWVAGTDAGTTPARLAHELARALRRAGIPTGVRRAAGGSSETARALLGPHATDGAGGDLLVVHSGTFADVGRERDDIALPGVPLRAARAARLLRAATPVAALADDALLLAADPRFGPRTVGALADSLRATPGRLVFGIGADAWSKASLATLVAAVGAPGRVPYRLMSAPGVSGVATAAEPVDVVVAPASELRGHTRLRQLAQSDAGPRLLHRGRPLPRLGAARGAGAATGAGTTSGAGTTTGAGTTSGAGATLSGLHRWIALVAPPRAPSGWTVRTAARVQAVTRSRAWSRVLARHRLARPPAGPLDAMLARERRAIAALLATAARIDHLAMSTGR